MSGVMAGSAARTRPSASSRVNADGKLQRRREKISEVSEQAFKTRAVLTLQFSLQGRGAENEPSWQVSTSRLERFNFASV